MLARMRSLVTCQLTGRDITLSWMSRLMMPLQQRAHKMCFYSGRLDPTRLSRRDPCYHNLKEWLWTISKERLPENWKFSLAPYNRENRAPRVSSCSRNFCLSPLLSPCSVWLTFCIR